MFNTESKSLERVVSAPYFVFASLFSATVVTLGGFSSSTQHFIDVFALEWPFNSQANRLKFEEPLIWIGNAYVRCAV